MSSPELAAQRIDELHREAAKQRLIRELENGRGRAIRRRRTVWRRLRFWLPRPAGA